MVILLARRRTRRKLPTVSGAMLLITSSIGGGPLNKFFGTYPGAKNGHPYGGARSILNDQLIIIEGARLGPDIAFAIRGSGEALGDRWSTRLSYLRNG